MQYINYRIFSNRNKGGWKSPKVENTTHTVFYTLNLQYKKEEEEGCGGDGENERPLMEVTGQEKIMQKLEEEEKREEEVNENQKVVWDMVGRRWREGTKRIHEVRKRKEVREMVEKYFRRWSYSKEGGQLIVIKSFRNYKTLDSMAYTLDC